jgi:hypothetical protein
MLEGLGMGNVAILYDNLEYVTAICYMYIIFGSLVQIRVI